MSSSLRVNSIMLILLYMVQSDTGPATHAVSCGSPPAAPANGRRSGSGTTYQSTVTYTCNSEYSPTPPGPNTVTCMANGQWSGSAPRCADKIGCDIVCMNGGTQDSSTCKCTCAPEYTGRLCETITSSGPVANVSMKILEFNSFNWSNAPLTNEGRNTIQSISQDLYAALNTSDKDKKSILQQDLITVDTYMGTVATLGENNGLFEVELNETLQMVANVISEVLYEVNTPAFTATPQDSTSPNPGDDQSMTLAVSILQRTERVASVTASASSEIFTISKSNLVMDVKRFSFNSPQPSGVVVFPGPGVTWPTFRFPERIPQVHFPKSFLFAASRKKAPPDTDSVEVVNVVLNNMEKYLPIGVVVENEGTNGVVEDTLAASLVLSSQIPGYDGGEVATNETVEIMFPVNENLEVPPGRVKQFRCAFFNFTGGANSNGGWSYRGLETDVINSTHVRCKTSHLTTFVVLVNIIAVQPPPAPFSRVGTIFYYIACSISLLCVLACIIFFLTLGKELIQKLHNFVHLNLCIALFLGLLLFLTGIHSAPVNPTACKVVTAFLHYFFLATFTWTLCQAVLMFILLVKVFEVDCNDKRWIILYLALGWALPIPIVLITGGARHDFYLIRSHGYIEACWLPSENGLIFAFIVPVVAIVVVNAVLLTITVVSLTKSHCYAASETKKREKVMEAGKYLMKAIIILVPLLAFTWITGLFAVGDGGEVSVYLFVVANVLQGLFVVLLLVVGHEKVFRKIKSKFAKFTNKKKVTLNPGSTSTAGNTWIDSTDKSSYAVENRNVAVEFEEKEKDEDEMSFKDEGDLEVNVDVM